MDFKHKQSEKSPDPIAIFVGALVARFLSQELDRTAKYGKVKEETVTHMKECLPGIAQGIAEACPNGIPEDEYSPVMIVVATPEGSMSIGLKDWPIIDDDLISESKIKFNNADLWAAIAEAADKGDPLVVTFAILARLGPEGLADIKERSLKCAQDGFTPVVLVCARKSPDHKRASGFCTVSYLPGRFDKYDIKH